MALESWKIGLLIGGIVAVIVVIIIVVVVMGGKNNAGNTRGPCVPLARAATVYTGCGYTYESQAVRDAECPDPATHGTSQWIGDGIDECTLAENATVYTGCGYTYASRAARDAQCPWGHDTSKWVRA